MASLLSKGICEFSINGKRYFVNETMAGAKLSTFPLCIR